MRRPRLPSADEAALWRNHVRDVAPLSRDAAEVAQPIAIHQKTVELKKVDEPKQATEVKKPSKPLVTKPAEKLAATTTPAFRPFRPMPSPLEKPVLRRADRAGPVDIDRRTWQRLHRGEMVVELRLDLHGLTQIAAYDRLVTFVDHAWRVGSRCVLVITGRGSADVGILRTMTPRWLDEIPMRDKVLAYAQAKTHHGGAGALYVLIRRRRID